MAYNVEQLINLQDQISGEPIMPDSLDRYAAMKNFAQQGGLTSMLNEGGQPSIDAQVQNLASKGRYGDTMLMHVNPKEVAGLGGLTINPETGLPEAFWQFLPFIAKAMIIGAGVGAGRRAIGGKKAGSWIQNLLGGAALGAAGAGVAGKAGGVAAGAPALASGTTAAGSAAASGVPASLAGAADLYSTGLAASASPLAASAAPTSIAGAANLYSTGLAGGAGAGTAVTPVGLGSAADVYAAGGAGGLPPWAEKMFTSKLWQGVEEHPYRTAGVLGMGAAMFPEEQEYVEPTVPKVIEEDLPPAFAARQLRGYGPEEEYIQTALEGDPAPYFVGNEGGLLSLANGGVIGRQAGGGAWTGNRGVGAKPPPSGFTYVPGMGPGGGPKLMTVEDAGGLYTTQGGVSTSPGFTPSSQLPSSGGGGGGPSPFEFPDVDPFQSGLSSFNVEDRLSRILGSGAVPQQFTLPSTPTTLPDIPASVPAANLQQGPSAMESLFSRFQQAQGDPIIDLVSESVTPSQQGGLIGLYGGGQAGLGASGVSGGSFGLTGGSASGMAGSGPGAGGAGIGTGITGGETMAVPAVVTRTGEQAPATEAQVYSKTKGVPYTVTGGDIAEAKTLNAIGEALGGGAQGPQTAISFVTSPIATMLGDFMAKSTPQSVAESRAYLASETGKARTAAESAAVAQRGDPSGGGDPFHVPNPILGEGPMAAGTSAFINQGGIVGLANGGVFEGRVQGNGDGMADQIAFNVVPQTPQDIPKTPDMALLSSDEYVVPADVVSMLGNGSSTAGAQSLDKFNQLMRRKAHGTNRQQRELNAGKELSRLT